MPQNRRKKYKKDYHTPAQKCDLGLTTMLDSRSLGLTNMPASQYLDLASMAHPIYLGLAPK